MSYSLAPRVYIAGPYSRGNVVLNVRSAIVAGTYLLSRGLIPYIPHLTLLWEVVVPQSYRTWLEYDKEWLLLCDAVLRLPGESRGAEEEVSLAEQANIPVFYTKEALMGWASTFERAKS